MFGSSGGQTHESGKAAPQSLTQRSSKNLHSGGGYDGLWNVSMTDKRQGEQTNASTTPVPVPDASCLKDALHKAAWRLLPFLLLLYILAFLDRVNVGYAKQALMRDVGLSETVYAFGASIFFIGYALFEVPSNLIMHRVGARAWMCRIMVTWGLLSAGMIFAKTAPVFYILRFLLGVAEAGFFPGVILYLTYWFPSKSQGPMMGLFYFGAPLAQILGGPLSGLLLELDGFAGLQGWQWMFLVEGLLASSAGIWTYWYLTNRPADAHWLSAAERNALQTRLDSEDRAKMSHGPGGTLAALRQPRLLQFGLTYGLIQASVYGVTFYLPSHVAHLLNRETGYIVGLASAIPWTCALIAAYAAPRMVGRLGSRTGVAAGALFLAGAGIAISATSMPLLAMAGLCLATAGFIGAQPIFWTFPTNELTGASAAGGLALINSMGAVGAFLAPNLKAGAERSWGTAAAGQFALAATTVAGALLVLLLPRGTPRPPSAEQT
jgi:MFS family permease